jgi:hypothetical protein
MEAADSEIALLPGHRQQAGILGLPRSEGKGVPQGSAKRVFIDAIGGYPSGAPIQGGTDRNDHSVFGDVLMNGVVGEASEGFDRFVDVHLGFGSALGSGETQDGGGEIVEFALRAQP